MNRKEFESQIVARALQDEAFRKALKDDPRGVLSKALSQVHEGAHIPESIQVEVLEESPNKIYIVLPPTPQSVGQLSDEQLAGVSGGAGSNQASTVSVAVTTITPVSAVLDNGVAVQIIQGGPIGPPIGGIVAAVVMG